MGNPQASKPTNIAQIGDSEKNKNKIAHSETTKIIPLAYTYVVYFIFSGLHKLPRQYDVSTEKLKY